MKRNLLSALFLIISSIVAQAQKFYVRAGAGYAFPHAAQIAGTSSGNGTSMAFMNGSISTGVGGTDFTIKKISFASGPVARIAAGYMFSKNIGVDIEGNFSFFPNKHTLTTTLAGSGYSTTYIQKAIPPIMLTPALLLQTGGEKLNAYTRFGVTLPLSAKVEDEINTVFSDSARSSNGTKSIQRPRLSLGFSAAAGVKYPLATRLSIWTEISLLSMSLYARESELTELTRNGVNNIDLIPKDKRIYKYKFSGNTATNAYYTYSMPFSNIAACVGISYDF